MTYRLTHSARRDLEKIYDYIAEDSLQAAGRMIDRFTAAFRKLAETPGLGHFREDLTREPFRFWAVGSYLVLYRPATHPLEILRVIHGARDVRAILEGD
jgi:plasmid stabilization system protein ParE